MSAPSCVNEQVTFTKSEALNAGSALEVHVLHVWYQKLLKL